jgi:RNA polymerase sigma factor for flagellar operon FliA
MNRARRDSLAVDHLKLVPVVVNALRRSLPPSHSVEDLCGMGALALVKAAEQYDPKRNHSSSNSYFAQKIRFGILDQIRKIEHHRRVGKRPALVQLPPVQDRFRDERQRLEGSAIASVDVPRLMQSLPERWQEALRLYYWHGLTMRQCGDRLGVNESRISQIHKAALAKMTLALFDRTRDAA